MYFSFSWFSVYSPYSRSCSVHFSFFMFFNIYRHISLPNEYYSHFPWFSFSRDIPCPTVCIYHFSCFSIFFVIFHYLMSVILISRDFQFSRHSPGPTVCISNFSRLQLFRHFSSRQVDVPHFPGFSVFLPYSMSYNGHC